MTEGDPRDKLSATRQFVLVVRVVVQGRWEVTGELVDPVSKARRRVTGRAAIVDAVRVWIDDALGRAAPSEEK
jgi:hypothetical protein